MKKIKNGIWNKSFHIIEINRNFYFDIREVFKKITKRNNLYLFHIHKSYGLYSKVSSILKEINWYGKIDKVIKKRLKSLEQDRSALHQLANIRIEFTWESPGIITKPGWKSLEYKDETSNAEKITVFGLRYV